MCDGVLPHRLLTEVGQTEAPRTSDDGQPGLASPPPPRPALSDCQVPAVRREFVTEQRGSVWRDTFLYHELLIDRVLIQM